MLKSFDDRDWRKAKISAGHWSIFISECKTDLMQTNKFQFLSYSTPTLLLLHPSSSEFRIQKPSSPIRIRNRNRIRNAVAIAKPKLR